MILDLPNDVAALIFHRLDLTDLPKIAQVCKKWHLITQKNSFWLQLIVKYWPHLLENQSNQFKRLVFDELQFNKKICQSKWKNKTYSPRKKNSFVGLNVLNPKFSEREMINAASLRPPIQREYDKIRTHQVTYQALHDSVHYSGVSISTRKFTHLSAIKKITVKSGRLYILEEIWAGHLTQHLKIYNLGSEEIASDTVLKKVQASHRVIWGIDTDCQLRVWNTKTGKEFIINTISAENVHSIEHFLKKPYILYKSGLIEEWDKEFTAPLHSYHFPERSTIHFNFVISIEKETLNCRDLFTRKLYWSKNLDGDLIQIQTYRGLLLTQTDQVKIYQLRTGNLLNTLPFFSPRSAVLFHEKRIVGINQKEPKIQEIDFIKY